MKMENRNRIVITGLGVASPIGSGVEAFWQAVERGASGTRGMEELIDLAGIPVKIGAPVEDLDLEALRELGRNPKKLDRSAQLTLIVAREALDDAHLDSAKEEMERVGVLIGTGIGGILSLEESHRKFILQVPRRVSPRFISQLMPNSLAAEVALTFGFRGPNFGVVAACASANHAIGLAGELLRNGFADLVVTGGGRPL